MHALIHYCLLSSKISYSFRLMAMKRAPKRANSDNYLQFGFTSLVTDGIEKPQCVICLKVLSAESMKPFQLKRHFEKEHPTYKEFHSSREKQIL